MIVTFAASLFILMYELSKVPCESVRQTSFFDYRSSFLVVVVFVILRRNMTEGISNYSEWNICSFFKIRNCDNIQ